MDKLKEGCLHFMQEGFEQHKELFKSLGENQYPHTLFIGCSDSRVIPNLITSTLPGELFVVRNIANIVPPYRNNDDYLATVSAIEYALNYLCVDNIIICGHSKCGGCKDISSEKAKKMPSVAKWVSQLDDIKKQIDFQLELSNMQNEEALRSWMVERANVLKSYSNLLEYPGVADKLEAKTLSIKAWYFIIETAEVYEYDSNQDRFISIKEIG